MPVFQHNGALHAFVHVPKCGGTTVEAMLKDRFGPLGFLDEGYYAQTEPARWSRTSPQHLVWADFIRLVPEAMIGTVFAVIRHPLARFASSYNFYARAGAVPAGMGPEEWFGQVDRAADLLPFRADNHLRLQTDFVPQRAVVFRLEDGLAPVADWLDRQFGQPGRGGAADGNVAPDPDPARFRVIDMPAALRRRIESFYAADYARFGYDREPPRPVRLTLPLPRNDSLAARLRVKLFARRIEYRLRRLESRALTAAYRAQHPAPDGREAETG